MRWGGSDDRVDYAISATECRRSCASGGIGTVCTSVRVYWHSMRNRLGVSVSARAVRATRNAGADLTEYRFVADADAVIGPFF